MRTINGIHPYNNRKIDKQGQGQEQKQEHGSHFFYQFHVFAGLVRLGTQTNELTHTHRYTDTDTYTHTHTHTHMYTHTRTHRGRITSHHGHIHS